MSDGPHPPSSRTTAGAESLRVTSPPHPLFTSDPWLVPQMLPLGLRVSGPLFRPHPEVGRRTWSWCNHPVVHGVQDREGATAPLHRGPVADSWRSLISQMSVQNPVASDPHPQCIVSVSSR